MELMFPEMEGTWEVYTGDIRVDNEIPSCDLQDKDAAERHMRSTAKIAATVQAFGGILQPVVVCRETHDQNKYILIDGWARLDEAKRRRWPTVKANVYPPMPIEQRISMRLWLNNQNQPDTIPTAGD